MSRKDYEAMARILADHTPVQGEAVDIQHRDLIDAVANMFAADNPNFDRERFLTACGVN